MKTKLAILVAAGLLVLTSGCAAVPMRGSGAQGDSGSPPSHQPPQRRTCYVCGGSGSCSSCNGSGMSYTVRGDRCPVCSGGGRCKRCYGMGYLENW